MRSQGNRLQVGRITAIAIATALVALSCAPRPDRIAQMGATLPTSTTERAVASISETALTTSGTRLTTATAATPAPAASPMAASAAAAVAARAPRVELGTDVAVQVAASTVTPTATPVATPAPAPAAIAGRRPSANAASAGFAPPPSKGTVSPPNDGGIARIVSSRFGLDHYIDVLGIVNNSMESPDHDGSYAVGWYSTFGAPGVPGNAVFSAHETWNHYQGPFYYMYLARPGDRLSLDLTDGKRYTYEVIRATRYTVDNIPMVEVLYPSDRPASEQWITLITCGGEIVYGPDGFGDYIDRDVVVMRRVS